MISVALPVLQPIADSLNEPCFCRLTVPPGAATPMSLGREGLRLLRENRVGEAVAILRSAVEWAPNDPLLWNNLAIALQRAESPGEAAVCLERSVALSPHQPDAWILLGMARKKSGDCAGAEAAYRVAIQQSPRSAVAWQCLGEVQQEQRDYAAAIDSYATCAQCGEVTGVLLATLGCLYYLAGRIPEAYEAYHGAVQLDPDNPHYRRVLRRVAFARDLMRGDSVDRALATYRQATAAAGGDADAELGKLLTGTFGLLSGLGHLEAATRLGEKQLDLNPGSASMKYLLRAIAAEPGLECSPADYLVEHFDAFAESFDAQLVGVLGYDVPAKITSLLRQWVEPGRRYDVLDGGCGTGLCGPLLHGLARRLTGVDLSPKMLDRAARRGCYDDLIRQELTAFLDDSPGRFDLVVAADVVIYFGSLGRFFATAAKAIRPGGLLAFSTERWSADGYQLDKSGRFAHATQYVQSAAGSAFVPCACVATTIRLEQSASLRGDLFVFRRAVR